MDAPNEIEQVIAALDPILLTAHSDGGRLPPERAMAEMLGVSRRRLRTALDHLQYRGRIFRRHGQGTFVTPPPHPGKTRSRLLAGRVTFAELMEVRLQIEPRMAELAATQRSAEDLAQLAVLTEHTRRTQSPDDYDLADEVFHYRIAELADNALFLEIYDLVRQLRGEARWRERRVETHVPSARHVLGEQHQRIFDAIALGDRAMAGEAVRIHLRHVAAIIETVPS
ncbi:MAG: FadR/GntR family transcriptional regulator [Pseudorhodobacter sp.]